MHRIRPSSSLALAAVLTLAGGAGIASAAFITVPVEAATYELGEVVPAVYTCESPCAFDVANGQPIDTSTVGSKIFEISDAAGPDSHTYFVEDTPPDKGDVALTVTGKAFDETLDYELTGDASDPRGPLQYGITFAPDDASSAPLPGDWYTKAALPEPFPVPGSLLEDDARVFLWARDTNGTAGVVDTVTARHDTTAPVPPTPASPEAGTLTADDTPALTWTAADGTGTSIAEQWLVIDDTTEVTVPFNATTANAPSLSDGSHTWAVRVRDAAGNEATGPKSTLVVDATPPKITITSPAANSEHEYGSVLTAQFSCDGTGSDLNTCVGPTTLPTNGLGMQSFTVEAADLAGNTAEVARQYEVVDTIAPAAPGLLTPGDDVTTNDTTPTFAWQAADPLGGSPIAGYTLTITRPGPDLVVPLDGGATSHTLTTPLAEGDYDWQVTARDGGGKTKQSPKRGLRIDLSAPAAPNVLFPASPTNDDTPLLTLAGVPGATFNWKVTGPDDDVVGGSTAGATVELGPLQEGVNVISVTQTTPAGNTGAAAEKVLVVDRTGPAVPAISSRPEPAATDTTPSFGWTPRETGGTFEWMLRDGLGAPIAGSTTNGTSVELGPLGVGSFTFQVRQIDAAGNAGGWAGPVPFSILPAPDQPGTPPPAATPAATTAGTSTGTKPNPPKGSSKIKPQTSNTSRLKPSAGSVLTTVRPRLRWKKVKGATLYNVQIFRMKGSKFTKVHSVFPRGTSVTVPRGRLAKGERYVWRVWSFKGRSAASRPIGVSYFDVAAAKRRAR